MSRYPPLTRASSYTATIDALTCNLFALPAAPTPAPVPSDFLALCERAVKTGLVSSDDAARALHLLDESPLIEWVKRAADPRIRFVPGVGLLSETLVSAVTGDVSAAPTPASPPLPRAAGEGPVNI